jgi:hypothetical protein
MTDQPQREVARPVDVMPILGDLQHAVELLVAFRTDAAAELLAQGRRIAALETQLAAGSAR